MGMFDYVQCEHPVPGSPDIDDLCQTKDTPSQSLDTYKIDINGYLWHEEYEIESVRKNASDILNYNLIKRTNVNWKKCDDYSGPLEFYGNDIHDNWWYYRAEFDNGLMTSLKLVDFPEFGGSFGDEIIKEKI